VGSGNRYTLFAMATTSVDAVPRASGAWTLQHRRPQSAHWIVIGHFPVKEVAQEAAKAFVAAGYGAAADFRVRRSKEPLD
jgi:hypothetical protein